MAMSHGGQLLTLTNDRFHDRGLDLQGSQPTSPFAAQAPMLRITVAQLPEPAACDLVLTNESAASLWNIVVSVDEILCAIFFIDDTHMPEESRLPPVRLRELAAGSTTRLPQRWDLTRMKRVTGDCLVDFSTDEHGKLLRRGRLPFSVESC